MATNPTAPISSLRQWMLHDMMMRGLSPRTQHQYVRNVQRFAAFLERPPDTAMIEDLRKFQVHQHECGANAGAINSTVSALRFFYTVTLRRRDLARGLVAARRPDTVREVLSVEEAARLLEAAPGIKYKAALGVAYGELSKGWPCPGQPYKRREMSKAPSPFRYFHSLPEVIRLVVMLYVRFPLSLRNVEDLLFEHGIDLCHETVRLWWNRFGPMFAADIRRQRVSRMRAFRHWRWHVDEVYVKINGEIHYLWRAVDHEGEILESFVTKQRDKAAALRFFRKTLKGHGRVETIVTDGLRSYPAAMRELGNLAARDGPASQ